MPEKQDLRALIQDRKAKQSRPIVRHTFSLAPELFADLGELTDIYRAERLAELSDPDDDDPDPRMGKVPAAASLAEQIKLLEAEIEATSVVGLFKALTVKRQSEYNDMFEADEADYLALQNAMILETFTYFEQHRVPVPADELGKADLSDLLEALSQGETTSLVNKIAAVSGGAPDIPLSVRQSLNSRR